MDVPTNCVELTRYFYPKSERPDSDLQLQLIAGAGVVDQLVTHPLQSYQREALICLLSDLLSGYAASPNGSFEKSFLLTALNKGMMQVASAEFFVFCYGSGKIQQKAWEKRRAEQYLFLRGQLLF